MFLENSRLLKQDFLANLIFYLSKYLFLGLYHYLVLPYAFLLCLVRIGTTH